VLRNAVTFSLSAPEFPTGAPLKARNLGHKDRSVKTTESPNSLTQPNLRAAKLPVPGLWRQPRSSGSPHQSRRPYTRV